MEQKAANERGKPFGIARSGSSQLLPTKPGASILWQIIGERLALPFSDDR